MGPRRLISGIFQSRNTCEGARFGLASRRGGIPSRGWTRRVVGDMVQRYHYTQPPVTSWKVSGFEYGSKRALTVKPELTWSF